MLTVNNKIIKWKNINWNKIIGYRRIIFPNNMEAEVFSIDRQLPPGTIYYTLKFIYNFVKHRIPDMKQPMRKHFEDIGDFIDGYEAGVIRHWWDFYKTAADWVKEWDNLSVKEFREKVNKLEGKKVY